LESKITRRAQQPLESKNAQMVWQLPGRNIALRAWWLLESKKMLQWVLFIQERKSDQRQSQVQYV